MNKRIIVVFLLTSALFLSAGQAADQTKKQITVWSWFISSTMAKSIKAFEEKNPGLEVKYTYYNYSPEYITSLKAAAASNSLPDIIGLQPGSLTQQYREQVGRSQFVCGEGVGCRLAIEDLSGESETDGDGKPAWRREFLYSAPGVANPRDLVQ
jgi:Bacterial extracellular solute-binding protein